MPRSRLPGREVRLAASGRDTGGGEPSWLEPFLDSRGLRLGLFGALGCLLLGLLAAGAGSLGQINTQGIAHLLLARHYAAGDLSLAFSGFWSPLLGLLIGLGMAAGWEEAVAARAAMGLSGLLFWSGTVFLCGTLRLGPVPVLAAAWAACGMSVAWSVAWITPDLLGAALLVWAFALSLRARRPGFPKAALWAGACWAAMYYASAALLPAAAAVLGGLLPSFRKRGLLGRWALLAALAAALMLPWWIALSLKRGAPSVGEVWRVERAVLGPPDIDRYYPCFGRFSEPPPGRLSGWEDPSLYDYPRWSPFGDPEYRSHQAGLLRENLASMAGILGGFALLGFGWLALAGALAFRVPGEEPQEWRWSLLPVPALALAWLPLRVAPHDERFLYAAYPMVLAAGLGLAQWLLRTWPRLSRPLILGSAIALAGLASLSRGLEALPGTSSPGGVAARELAERIRSAGLPGPVAGDGLDGGCRNGLYLACLLGEEWLGSEPGAREEEWLASGARLVVLSDRHPSRIDLELSPRFRDLVREWYGEDAGLLPLRVFAVSPPDRDPEGRRDRALPSGGRSAPPPAGS